MRHDLTARGDNRALVRYQNIRVDVGADRHQRAVVGHRLSVVGDDERRVYILPGGAPDEADEPRPSGEADGHSSPPSVASAIFWRSASASHPMNGRLPTTRSYSARSSAISSASAGFGASAARRSRRP